MATSLPGTCSLYGPSGKVVGRAEGPERVEPPRSVAVPGTTGVGAFPSLPGARAKVPSQSDLPTFVKRGADCELRAGKPPEGKLDGGEGDEGNQSFAKTLIGQDSAFYRLLPARLPRSVALRGQARGKFSSTITLLLSGKNS
jgi:hypothetical protein